eukprot:CAMPEP_0185903384 /NCGR_PEP_ID=MMETSP0196C-20130402/2602_1 /TAXON_ID=2932 /ORGANISM="Alexandrium fundyense, Strain CCMP1719" /LENGTH=34 /DNA_ID= /DNA_START= /DNA_END= /DNA_ORIENTATION=
MADMTRNAARAAPKNPSPNNDDHHVSLLAIAVKS